MLCIDAGRQGRHANGALRPPALTCSCSSLNCVRSPRQRHDRRPLTGARGQVQPPQPPIGQGFKLDQASKEIQSFEALCLKWVVWLQHLPHSLFVVDEFTLQMLLVLVIWRTARCCNSGELRDLLDTLHARRTFAGYLNNKQPNRVF